MQRISRILMIPVLGSFLALGVGCGDFQLPDLGAPPPSDDDDADSEDDDDDSGEGEGEGGEGGEGEGEGEGDEGFSLCCLAGEEGIPLAYDCGAEAVPACEGGDTSACFRNGGRDGECT